MLCLRHKMSKSTIKEVVAHEMEESKIEIYGYSSCGDCR